MTIQERKDNIYHDYGVIITEEMDAIKMRDLLTELNQLADDLEDQETLIESMRNDMLDAIEEVASKYKKYFDTIYLYGNNVANIDIDDISVEI